MTRKNKEGFFYGRSSLGGYCGDCGSRGRYNCSKCIDCGYCTSYDGSSECVPGDINGPYFRKDCVNWEYNYLWSRNYVYPTIIPYYQNRRYYRKSRPIHRRFLHN